MASLMVLLSYIHLTLSWWDALVRGGRFALGDDFSLELVLGPFDYEFVEFFPWY